MQKIDKADWLFSFRAGAILEECVRNSYSYPIYPIVQVTPDRTSSRLLQPGFLQTAATRATTAATEKLSGDSLKPQDAGIHSPTSLIGDKQRILVTASEARVSGRSQGSKAPKLKTSPSAKAESQHSGVSQPTREPGLIKAAWNNKPTGAKQSSAEQHGTASQTCSAEEAEILGSQS